MQGRVETYRSSDAIFGGKADVAWASSITTAGPHWVVGDRFRAIGLAKTPQYNGCAGKVITMEDTGRCGVLLDDVPGLARKIALRPENMLCLFPLMPGGEATVVDDISGGNTGNACSGVLLPIKRPTSLREGDAFLCAVESRDSLGAKDQDGWQRFPVVPELNSIAVEVAPSSKAGSGLGVFSGPDPIVEGRPITQYAGWRVNPDIQSQSRYRLDLVLQSGSAEQARICAVGDPAQSDPKAGVAQFMNDAGCIDIRHCSDIEDAISAYVASVQEANVRISFHQGALAAFATRDIPPNTELLLSYGAAYWLDALKLRIEPTHDIELLRKVEDLIPISTSGEEAKKFPSLSVKSEVGLWNETSDCKASRADCEEVLRMAMGGPFLNHQGKNMSELACCALLQGAPAGDMGDAVYVLEDCGGLDAVRREVKELGGYKPLPEKMCDMFKDKLQKVVKAHDEESKAHVRCKEALALLDKDPQALVGSMLREGALQGFSGYNKIIQALDRVPDLGALAFLSPGVWASSVASLVGKAS